MGGLETRSSLPGVRPGVSRRSELLLTGRRRQGRILAIVSETSVWLTVGMFSALCELVQARSQGTGYVSMPPMTVCRLRREMRAGVVDGDPTRTIVETGVGTEYRLALDLAQVALESSFRDVPVPRVLVKEVKAKLLECCHLA